MSNKLPAGWVHVTIANLVDFNPKTNAPDELQCGFVPMQGLGTAFRAILKVREAKPWGQVRKLYTHFQDGDVLVAKVTPCFENGKAGVVTGLPNGIGAGSSEFCVFRPSEALVNKILLAWFSTDDFRRRATVAMTGSVGLKRVPKDIFLGELLPLPPKAEQVRIADKLDSVLVRVDAVNERLACVAPLLKRFRNSVLAAAFSGRLSKPLASEMPADGSERLVGWQKIKLKELAVRVSVGHVGPTSVHYTNSSAGVPLVRSQNVRPGRLSVEGVAHITDAFHESLKKSQLKPGDLLVVRVGANRGDSCIVPLNQITPLNCANIVFARPDQSKVMPEYLGLYFQSPVCQELLLSASVGGAQGVINTSVVSEIVVPLPTIAEQVKIVQRVELLLSYADSLETRLLAAHAAAQRLTPALLSKAFRGELVPQDPNDEPAGELLRRLGESRPHERPASNRARKSTA